MTTAAKFKRFYARASWEAAAPGKDGPAGAGFRVLLDGKAPARAAAWTVLGRPEALC